MQDNAASIAGVKIRITRLNADNTLMTGPSASYVTSAFISVSITPEYEDGDEFVQKNAGGEICTDFRTDDTIKRVGLEIAICNPDPEFTSMIAGGELLVDANGVSVGWAAPAAGTAANPNGVAIEVWSKAVKNGKVVGDLPYWHWVFPYAKLREGGDRVIENDILATSFEGWATGNEGFGTGPAAPVWPFISDRPYAWARSTEIPAGSGYQAVTA